MARTARGGLLAALVLSLLVPTARAADEPAPTEVTDVSAEVSGDTLSVAGDVAFGGQAPVIISEDAAGDGPIRSDLATAAGVDLTKAAIYQPDPDDPTLIFEWTAANLPDTGSLPEAVRYTFPFVIGEKSFQPQAKLTNFASITLLDDAPGHARPPGHFQLRGNCVTNYPIDESPLANCPHVAWLDGAFDTETDTVRLEMPIGAEFAPEVVPGAVLERTVVASTTIVAAFQAVVSNAQTSDEAIWDDTVTYTVPSKTVELGVAPAGTDPSDVTYGGQGTVDKENGFVGDVDVSGLAAGKYEVFVRACFADNCGVATAPFTLS